MSEVVDICRDLIRIDTTKLSAEEAADLVVAQLQAAGVTGPA